VPEWRRWVADNQPITPIIGTVREHLTDAEVAASTAWLAVGWGLGPTAAGMVWCRWLFALRNR
jgi:ABC-2 type transport system permease protein